MLTLESIAVSYCSIFKITQVVTIHDICHPIDCQVALVDLSVYRGVRFGPHCSMCNLPEATYF